MNWKTELRPTDILDPATGDPLYVHARIRPQWFWVLRRMKLFLLIVWRVCDEPPDGRKCRLSWSLAWDVSAVAMGPKNMTKEQAIEELKTEQANDDTEVAHSNADDILCKLLTALGHAAVVAEYEKVRKWYA